MFKQPSYKTLQGQVPTMSVTEIRLYAGSLVELWLTEELASFDFPKAFSLLRHTPIRQHIGYEPLMRVTIQFHIWNRDNSYSKVSQEKKDAAHIQLQEALESFNLPNWFQLIPQTDRWHRYIRARYEAHFVFVRDPEGSIDLRAFSQDEESVHRSSTQSMIAESLAIVMNYPIRSDQQTLCEIRQQLAWLNTVVEDYETLSVPLYNQTVQYKDVLDHVWAFIRDHEHKEGLLGRLQEELTDSVNVCANGKLARLLNVLQGYDMTLPQVDTSEQFQERFARLREAPPQTRLNAANTLFEDFRIPEGSRGDWLQALAE